MASLNGTGGYAERVVVPAARLIEVPDGVALRDAVALLADGRTALALAGRAGLGAGDTVLVEAAAGGVGTLLVQIARHAGPGSWHWPASRASSRSRGISGPT